MNIRLCLTLILAIASIGALHPQELNCTVEINSDQVQGTNKSALSTLQEAISDYVNTTQFTSAQFAPNEKIDCRLFLTITSSEDNNTYSGTLQVQASRPVYNSSYTTTLLNFKDSKVDFTYSEGEPLIYSTSNMESQLTQIINFYVFLILAVDFDSFSPRGGDPYWERLKTIVQQAQSSGETGWKAFEDTKNRSALLSAFTDPATQGIRDLLYQYHRTGLDEMATSPDKGRAAITQSLEAITKMHSAAPMSVGLSLFKDSKLDELVNIYSEAPQQERTAVFDILRPVYPTETTRLDKIKKGKESR